MSQPNPPRGITVPATLAAIQTGLTTAINDAAVPVLLGMPTQWPEGGDVVIMAASVPGRAGVTHTLEPNARTQGFEESYDVTMAIVSVRSDNDMAARATRCGDLFNICRTWCDANRTLGGTVARMRVGVNVAWVPRQRGDGAEMTLGFSLHVAADI